jgi:hypothetical protein
LPPHGAFGLSAAQRPEVLEWNLPYEMLIVSATDVQDPEE